MAALNTIARDYADEIRDGIAWVIVWKTGRSWNATAVWLDPDTDTFEPDDLDTAREVLAQDPGAVMLNGYYCGHFGEDMTVAELADGIRWHYENGYNTLDGSTAFPAELEPRPEGISDDMPWYGKQTTEGPDPYVYDGGMSPEDYEHMHELIVADKQREEKPPDSMTLEITITKETAPAFLQVAQEGIERATQAIQKFGEWLLEAVRTAARIVRESVDKFVDAMLYKANDHPKWWHLYKHAKKARTRKKYRRRLMQQLTAKLAAAGG